MGYQPSFLQVDAAQFDGITDYCTRGDQLTGHANSKTGIFSTWFRVEQNDIFTYLLSNATNDGGGAGSTVRVVHLGGPGADGQIQFLMDSGLNMRTATNYPVSTTWHHLLASWDLATNSHHIYVDDLSDLQFDSSVDQTINYTKDDWAIAALPNGTAKFAGALAEFYFTGGQYLDFSVVANRRRFISANRKPVSLGATGSLPTGTTPWMYHHLDKGESAPNFRLNRGSGGNFTINVPDHGVLTTATPSPSD